MSGSPADPQRGVWHDVRNTLVDNINLKKNSTFSDCTEFERDSFRLRFANGSLENPNGNRCEGGD